MRTPLLLLTLGLALAACGRRDGEQAAFAEAADDADRIACRVDGAPAFAPACAVERSMGPQGLELTVRHPGGGFRRLLVTRDGRGVIAADGADKAVVTLAGDGQIEVALGADRYRLPATVKGPPGT